MSVPRTLRMNNDQLYIRSMSVPRTLRMNNDQLRRTPSE